MNAKISVSVFYICVEAIIYLLLYNLHDCTFNKTYIGIIHLVRAQNFPKNFPYQGVRNTSFSENFVYVLN